MCSHFDLQTSGEIHALSLKITYA